jgi:histidine triad (HIT) family protein
MVDSCVFCSIVERTAPAERVYENDFVVAIMDIHPATPGHVLVIPKSHSQDLWDIQGHEAEQTMAAAVHVAGMIRRALDPAGINLVHATRAAAWQSVFHFHLHLVPRYAEDGLVPPWRLDQPRAADTSLHATADRIRSAAEDDAERG